MKTGFFTKALALLLCLCMSVSLLPSRFALAESSDEPSAPGGETPDVPVTQDGENASNEDWDAVYPFGTFAFGNHQADIAEPGAKTAEGNEIPQSLLIPVYRLGGTTGRATVRILYAPAVTMDENAEEYVYDYAVSGREDILIEYENPNPIAAYQPVAISEEERRMTASAFRVTLPELPEEVLETDELQLILSGDAEADAYRWQVNDRSGWQDIQDANTNELTVCYGDLWDFDANAWTGMDFRCLYAKDGALFCTESLLGEVYESPYTDPEPVPEDLEIPKELGFTALTFENDYDSCEFDLTFADGETVKYIRVTAVDDAVPELPEMGLFTILRCEGGTMSDTCNTLTLMISDNETGEASEIGFTAETVFADRAEGVARVRIVRTGSKSYTVTVHYATEDGTALAGIDYAKTEGDMAFAGSIDEIEITVPLITNYDTDDKTFSLVLSDVRGGGEEKLCTLATERTVVTVSGKAIETDDEGTGQNLATLLTGADGRESASVTHGEDALINIEKDASLKGEVEMIEPQAAEATLVTLSATRSHPMQNSYRFTRAQLEELEQTYDDIYFWHDWDDVLGHAHLCYNDLDSAKTFSDPVSLSFSHDGGESGANHKVGWGTRRYGSGTEIDNIGELTRGFGGGYEVTMVDTNYRGQLKSSWNDSNAPGDYYDQLLMSFGWVRPGVRKTNPLEIAHRYLRPKLKLTVGSWSESKYFDVDTSTAHSATIPKEWEAYCRLKGRGDWQWNWAEKYNHNDKYSVPDGPYLSFGESFKIEMDFQFYNTWTSNESGTYAWAKTEDSMWSQFDIRCVSGHRRVFSSTGSNGIALTIYTANDKDANNDFTKIEDDSPIYDDLAPSVSIVSKCGGVDQNGNLYVGTKLKIDTTHQNKQFKIATDLQETGLYLESSNGRRIMLTPDSQDGDVWYCTMIWDGIGSDDLSADYRLCIYYTRKQNIQINIANSLPRDEHGAVMPNSVWEDFLTKTMTVKKSVMNIYNGSYWFEESERTWDWEHYADFTASGDHNSLYTLSDIGNIQSVCFHQDPDDVIVYNEHGYAGNAEIPLSPGDFTTDNLFFDFYDADYLERINTMTVNIDHVEVYFDKNGDGVISGHLNEDNMFILDVGADGETVDTYLDRITGDYPDSSFAPVLDDQNRLHQCFFKVYLRMTPRCLIKPATATGDEKAQLLPAFITAVTDPQQAAKLSEEQRMYRYIRGNDTDDLPMYGAEVEKLRTIDIPLGGDVGEIKLSSVTNGVLDDDGNLADADTTDVFTWTPDFRGNLLLPFEAPSPIIDTSNVTGGEVAIAGENPELADDGTYQFSQAGIDKLNGYLGSFADRTTFAIGVQEQKSPENGAGGSGIRSFSDIKPESIAIGPVRSVPSADNMVTLGSASEPGDTDGSGPDTNDDTKDFKQDFGTKLPALQFGLGNYATVIMDGYQVGFAISIPIYQNEKSKTYDDETEGTTADGAQKRSWKDEEQNQHEEYTYKKPDGTDVKAEVVTKIDPNDPNKRVKTITTETKKDGKTSYRKEVRTQQKNGNNWVGTGKTVTDTKPDIGAKEGFKKANKLDQLENFINACTSNDKDELDKFMLGAGFDPFRAVKNGAAKTKGHSVTFTVQIAIMFEYNPIDDCHYFKSAGLSAALGFEFTAQMRLGFCPLAYVYMKIGVEFKISMSLSCYRIAKYGDAITDFESGSLASLASGEEAVFALDMRNDYKKYRGFVFDLSGKVNMQIFDNAECTGSSITSGALSGDGGNREVLLKAYDKTVYIRLTPANGTEAVSVGTLRPIIGAESKVAFDGVTIEPSLTAEFGVGIGIEVAKLEVYIKVSTSIAFTMGGYLKETDSYEGFYISSFKGSIAAGFNIVLAFFSFSMDAIAFGFEGTQHGTGGYFSWHISCSSVNGSKEWWSKDCYTSADGKTLNGEPKPPQGTNIFPAEDSDIHFFKKDGTAVDLSKDAPKNQGWTFRTGVLPWRWSGGEFLGEIPLNADLAEADEDGVFVKFTPEESKIKLYHSGEIQIFVGSDTTGTKSKKSPVTINAGGQEVKLLLKKGAKLDRYTGADANEPNASMGDMQDAGSSLIHITGPSNITDRQKVVTPTSDTRAFTPTGTADFELSGYNTAGDAKELVKNLETGYDYLLVPAGGENYLIYPLMIGDADTSTAAPQLVASRIVMTGDLSTGTGLVHPTTGGTDPGYLVLDDDEFTDLSFDAVATDDALLVTWVTYDDGDNATYSVKQRTIPLTPDGTDSGPVKIFEGDDPCQLPATEKDATVWVSASGDGSRDNARLKAWLLAHNEDLTEEMLAPPYSTSDPNTAAAVFQWASQSTINRLNGDDSVLHVRIGEEIKTVTVADEHIQNLETATIDGRVYLLYTTTQTVYFDTTNDVPLTVGASDIDAATERSTIHHLYLRTVDANGFSPAVIVETVVDHDGCTRDTMATSRLKDGVYEGGSLSKEQADPYISNLRFVTADIDGTGNRAMALFEMGGNTWLLGKEDMDLLLDDAGASIELKPIFSETTGMEVAIGSDDPDGDGSLAIVYTAPIENSLSNAIFISWWDKNAQSWGNPTILAMRGLQIYEDRITYNMTPEEAEAAYQGRAMTPGNHTGTLDKLTFTNLQMSVAKVDHDGTEVEQLIILTNGALTPYGDAHFTMNDGFRYDTVAPTDRAAVGFYAIAFGSGEQAIGEGDLDFSSHDFTIGSKLMGEVSFRNTGTAALRASDADPLTVRLMVSEGGAEDSPKQKIAEWKLIKSIPSGRAAQLKFEALPLTCNLQEGAYFYLEVEENNSPTVTDPFRGATGKLFTVRAVPELSFNNFDLELKSVTDGVAIFSLDATVVNNGSADASEIFIQFSYDSGETDDLGNRIYYPVNITGSTLSTSEQTPVKRNAMQEDYEKGIYKLNGPDGGDLSIGYCRTVSGKLCVPTSCFVNKDDISGLHLNAEIYSEADNPNYLYGVYSSDHEEYNEVNNSCKQTVKHHTAFSVPNRIATALGTTLYLPVSFDATDDSPDLVLTELSDGTPDWTPRMGVCYYDADRHVIVAAPNSTAQALIEAGEKPTGILQLKDTATNTITAITYRIDTMGEGVNIYRDDMSFTFYDADGQETILYPEETDQPGWRFLDKGVSTGWTGGATPDEVPMNHDLSLADQDGAYFTFNTVADTMTFFFMGEITVESSSFGRQTFTSSPATMNFDNPTGAIHTLKVTAKAGTKIDRYVATYKTNPIVDPDSDAPQVLWNRSFPDVASVLEGESVPMTCYILDRSGIVNVSFDDLALSETTTPALVKVSDRLWYFDYTFTENGEHSIRVSDTAGNTGESRFYTEWFNSVLSTDANAYAPGLIRSHVSLVDAEDNAIGMSDPINYQPSLKSAYSLGEGEQSNVYAYGDDGLFASDPLEKAENEHWTIREDGIYMVRVDRTDGTWARAVFVIDGIDLIPPELSAEISIHDLKITAIDNKVLASVKVNGYPLTVEGSAFMGYFPVSFSGVYTVEAADAAGNRTTQSVSAEYPLEINGASTEVVCANGDIAIRLTVQAKDVAGGEFDSALSDPAQNVYTAIYEIALAPEGTTEAPETGWTALGDSCTLAVGEGVYELFVRNGAGETAKYANPLFLFHPMSWGTPTYDWVETEAGYTVTATSVCELDATHITTETIEVAGVVTSEPTCEEDGMTVYTANFKNALFTTQQKFVPIPAIGHQWGEPAYEWRFEEEYGWVADATSICEHDPEHVAEEHVIAESEVAIPPTCEDEGELLYTAVFESELFETQTMTQPIPPMGHKWGEPTYDWVVTEDGYAVTATTVCEHDPTHIGTETVPAVYRIVTPPTTRADGLGRWTATFTDERFTTQTKDIVLPMLCPTFYGEHLPAVDVAEYADGRTLYRYDVRIRNVDVDRHAVSIKAVVGYDPSILTFAEARTPFTGSIDVDSADGSVRFAWTTDGEAQPLPDGTVVASLYFTTAGPVANDTVAAFVFAEGTGFAYLNENGEITEADPVLYEDGSITFSIPDMLTLMGEDAIANGAWIRENGETLYRYDVRLCDLPESGLLVNSAQIFLCCDGSKLVFRRADGPVEWTATGKNGMMLFAWASETGVLLREDDVILTLWFAKGEGLQPGDRVEIAFTVNALGYPSSLSLLFAERVVEVEARTVNGSITFDPIVYGDANCDGAVTAADAALVLRAMVGLSELTLRGALNADVDEDGEITAADAAMILRYVVGMIDALPVP